MAPRTPKIPLPTDWPSHVKKAVLHVIALARVALTAARVSAKKRGLVARLHAKVEEQAEEIFRLEEELRLKDLRMGRLKPRRAGIPLKERLLRPVIFKKARASVIKKTGGHYPAPLEAIDVVRRGTATSLAEGLEIIRGLITRPG